MTKHEWLVPISFLIYFIAYLTGILLESDLVGNYLSPLGALLATGVLLHAFWKTDKFKMVWLMAALGTFTWFVADALWAFYEIALAVNPEDLDLFMYLYIPPNLFICISVFFYFKTQSKHWNRMQLALDAFFTFAAIMLVFSTLFMEDLTFSVLSLTAVITSTYIALLLDFTALFLIALAYLSTELPKKALSLRLLWFSVILYTICDIYYSFLVFQDAYIPNSLIDGAYMASLLVLSLAGHYSLKTQLPIIVPEADKLPINIGNSSRFIFMFLVPLLGISIKGLYLDKTILLLMFFLIHQVASGYTQRFIQNEHHLKDVKAINDALELKVQARTEELMALNVKYNHLAKLDSITYLYNRRTALEILDGYFSQLEDQERIVLYLIDIIRFRAVNAAYGHLYGDVFLKIIAERLESLTGSQYTFARIGGDEFAVIEKGFVNRFEMDVTANQILTLMSEPIKVEDRVFNPSVSVGISCYPTDAEDRASLLRNADMAMYHSKTLGLNKYTFFSTLATGPIQRRHEIEHGLKKALENNEFHLVYQPQIDARTRELIGMEALLRWVNSELGNVTPNEFIPIAEETGLIVPIGDWVVNQSIRQIKEWNTTYGTNFKMGINVSPTQLNTLSFITGIERSLQEAVIPPEWIDIEITETSTLESEVSMEEILTALSAMGISISIDDFGTGYSSLSYIKRFDIDRLKIAKPLVDGITEHYDDKQIVQAIIGMSNTLGVHTIAEGVETQEQAELLTIMGCNQFQGYYFGKPIHAIAFERQHLAYLKTNGNS